MFSFSKLLNRNSFGAYCVRVEIEILWSYFINLNIGLAWRAGCTILTVISACSRALNWFSTSVPFILRAFGTICRIFKEEMYFYIVRQEILSSITRQCNDKILPSFLSLLGKDFPPSPCITVVLLPIGKLVVNERSPYGALSSDMRNHSKELTSASLRSDPSG